MCKNNEPWADFVGYDLLGFAYNCKYPPNIDRYGREFGGYPTPNRETFFYDFCILGYGVAFYHNDISYEVEFSYDGSGPILKNYTTGEVQGPFEDAVNLIEEAVVNGHKMIQILDELENIVLH